MKNESRKERRKNKSKKRKGKSRKTKKRRSDRRPERGKGKGWNPHHVSYPFIYGIFCIPLLLSQYVRMLQFFRVSGVCVFFV